MSLEISNKAPKEPIGERVIFQDVTLLSIIALPPKYLEHTLFLLRSFTLTPIPLEFFRDSLNKENNR